jgi:hypothetical protein
MTNFFADTEFSQWSGIAARLAAQSKFAGGNRIGGEWFAISQQEHVLVRHADNQVMPPICRASRKAKDSRQEQPAQNLLGKKKSTHKKEICICGMES